MNFRSFFGTIALFFLLALATPLSGQIITNVVPPLGGHGELVLIKIFGNGFAPGNRRPNTLSVDFNGAISTTSTNAVVSDSEIDITNVPANATSGYIHISVNGNPAQSPLPFIIVPTNMPYATNFTPLYGANDTTVVISGVHFVTGQATNAMFNGVVSKKTSTTPFVSSDNAMTVTAPANVTTGPIVLMSKLGATHNVSTISNQITSATNFFVAPRVTSFSPTNGRPATNITVKGTNFIAASAVAFNGVAALAYTIMDNNTIQATVPTNTSTGVITVSPPNGTALSPSSSPLGFRMLPTIYSFSPNVGVSGTTITITGAGLNEKTTHPDVTVGGGSVTAFGTITPTSLTFNVPASATSGLIVITTTNGSIASAQNFYLPASISNIIPNKGAAGTIVTITGGNFTNASAVSFNGIPATTFAVTNNSVIGAQAPPGVTSGVITITTPFGATNSAGLFYVAPTITDFTPTHGLPGTNVILTGTSFTNATVVLFNGTPATSFVVSNNTTIRAVVPNNATTGKITVGAPGGTNQSAADFVIDSSDLSISLSAQPDPVFIGSNLTYTITVTNGGPTAALNVILTNQLPSNTTLKAAAISQGTLNTNNTPIVGTLGTINVGNFATVLLTVTPSVTGLITNRAGVVTDSQDNNTANNSAAIVTTVWPLPVLSITNLMSNSLVRVSWPAPLSSFTLQYRTDLSSGAFWSNDTAPRTVSGTNVTVIETNVGVARFFRLTN